MMFLFSSNLINGAELVERKTRAFGWTTCLSWRGHTSYGVTGGALVVFSSYVCPPRIDRVRQAEVGGRCGPMSLLNNRTEVDAPMTIQALTESLIGR